MKQFRFNWFAVPYIMVLSLFIGMATGLNPIGIAATLSIAGFITLPQGASLGNLGYAPYLLRHIKDVANGNTPSEKITSPGYMLYLAQTAGPVNVVNEGQDRADGTVQEMRIKYRNRVLEDDIQDEDNCEIDGVPLYKEATVSVNYFSKYAFFLDDRIIAQYMADAVKSVTAGQPATPMMQEHLGAIFEMLNAFYGKMDTNLLTKQASNFGMNIVEGNNAATTVNIEQDATINDLEDGLTKILADLIENELSGQPYIIGSGLFMNFDLQQFLKSANQAGIDTSKFLSKYKFLYDRRASAAWGTNQIGVFAPGAVKPLFRNKYMGNFAGKKGESLFFTMTPAVTDSLGNPLTHDLFKLDVQMKFIDCPQEITVNSYGGTQSVNRGWYLIFSKTYDQFNIPADAHASGDDLYQVNGTLRYTVTNT